MRTVFVVFAIEGNCSSVGGPDSHNHYSVECFDDRSFFIIFLEREYQSLL